MTRPEQTRRPEQGRSKRVRTRVKKMRRSGSRLRAFKGGKKVAGWVVYNTTVCWRRPAPRQGLVAGEGK